MIQRKREIDRQREREREREKERRISQQILLQIVKNYSAFFTLEDKYFPMQNDQKQLC